MPAVSDGIELLRQFFVWMSELESSIALRGSTYVAPWFQVSHVVFVSLFAGSVFFMDLRLVGIEFDAKTLRVVAEADGSARVAVTALP